MTCLDERLQSRDANNLDFLRLLAASCVILSHCFPLLGYRNEPFAVLTGYETFGQLGVTVFFCLSGLLITRSWDREPSATAFLRKRALRILPGLIASMLFCVLIVGPSVTTLPLAAYFTRASTYEFLLNVVYPGCTYWLAGVFRQNPNIAVNGSLWTLTVEFTCYGVVLLCGVCRLLNRRCFPWLMAAMLAVILWHYAVAASRGVDLTQCCLTNDRLCYVYFLAGAAAYAYRRRLVLNRWLALLAAALYIGTWSSGFLGYMVSFVTVPYLVLYVALTPVPGLQRWARYGDLSYGMYIYAFPVQQTLVLCLGTGQGVGTLFVASSAVTALLAYASWHLLEGPMLAWRPGRGRRKTAPAPLPPALGLATAAAAQT